MERAGTALYVGTLPGGLFRSTDDARSWQLDDALWNRPERLAWNGGGYDVPGIHSISPLADGTMLVGVSCGGAWITRDGGTLLGTDRTRHARRVHAARPGVRPRGAGSARHRRAARRIRTCCGASITTASFAPPTAAALWSELHAPLSSFGFAVAAHPVDPQTAWFVPAVKDQCRVPVDRALAVNRTRDGGATFDTLRAGLPQHDCYDLVYRHSWQSRTMASNLLMGSTTGGVWASDDGGDTGRRCLRGCRRSTPLRFG
jgi:hypothetical protein